MKAISQILLLSLAMPITAGAADQAPPPPPNPFSNLPAGEADSFTPFDDDFDEGLAPPPPPGATFPNTGGGGASFAPPPRGAGGPAGGSAPLVTGTRAKVGNPASCKELVENFDYPDAEILDVAKAIAKLTGRNFIYSAQDIKGRISVVSQTQITVCDAWNAFLTALNVKGFAIVPAGKYLRIERTANAKEKQTPIYSEKKGPTNDEFITRVIPLRYIDATEFENAFRLWIPREARMQAYGQTNTIIITDTASHINRMMELIGLLDVAGYQESLVVIPIRNAAAKDIAKLIESILNENSRSSTASFGARNAAPYSVPGARSSPRGRTGGSTISKIISDDRTNALIVKANAAGIQEIRTLVRRLDTKVAVSEGSGRIHVVTLRFANAEDLAKTLGNFTGGGGARSGANRAFPVFGEPAPTFQGDIKVSPDKTTQSLVITASPQDFASIKKVIDRLDQPRDQVYIEALIMEMGVNRSNSFGTSFVAPSSGMALPSASGNLEKMLQNLPPSGFVLGFKSGRQKADITVGNSTYKVNDVNGIVELIQANNDAQVIARPQITALDNEKATFEVSEMVPVPKSTLSNGVSVQSYEQDKAQLLLEVTPQINKGSNFVKLDINQKLENFDPINVPAELQGKQFGKNTRATNTKVFLQSDDTVVLSGMIRSKVSEIVQKVPLLGDIPVLGWLFKNSKTTNEKTNLMVFITPRIIKQYDKFRKILARRLEDHDEFVRESLGSIDPFGRDVTRMKKDLPDLTVIEPLPQVKPLETSSFQGPAAPSRDDNDDNQMVDPGMMYDPYGAVPIDPYMPQQPYLGDMPPPPPGAMPDGPMPEGAVPPAALPNDGGFVQ